MKKILIGNSLAALSYPVHNPADFIWFDTESTPEEIVNKFEAIKGIQKSTNIHEQLRETMQNSTFEKEPFIFELKNPYAGLKDIWIDPHMPKVGELTDEKRKKLRAKRKKKQKASKKK